MVDNVQKKILGVSDRSYVHLLHVLCSYVNLGMQPLF